MRVLLLITSLDSGGAQRHVRDLLAAQLSGIEFHVAGGTPGWLAREAARLGVAVHPVSFTRFPASGDVSAYREVSDLQRRLRPDLVHVHSTKAGFLGRAAAWRAHIPVLYTVHGWPFQTGIRSVGTGLALLGEYAVRGVAARVIVVSQRDAALALRLCLVRRDRLEIVENGIDAAAYPWHSGPYGRRFVYVGRLEHGKGLERLLPALAAVRDLPWELAVCGTGTLDGLLLRLAHRLNVADRVRFLGWVDDPRPILDASDCLVLPSDKEGLPYAVLEGLACGLFLIVTAVGALADLDLRQLFRAPPHDNRALARQLREFLADGWRDPARQPRRDEVAVLLRDRFNVARMINRVVDAYSDVLHGRPARSGIVTQASPRR